jgi:uncharacterized surface protein with fasciclin (FAS1) repeats
MRETIMNKSLSKLVRITAAAAVLSFGAGTVASFAASPVTVGGAPMYAEKNIIENAVNSKDHTTLVAAVKAAGLVETLSGAGPFTVFAPVNDAFAALPAGTVDSLLKPDMKDTLTHVLTYHVVAGKLSAEDLMAKTMEMGGALNLQTVSGDTITIQQNGDELWVFDETGKAAKITIADVNQSNGVIHVIDKVLMMKM